MLNILTELSVLRFCTRSGVGNRSTRYSTDSQRIVSITASIGRLFGRNCTVSVIEAFDLTDFPNVSRIGRTCEAMVGFLDGSGGGI